MIAFLGNHGREYARNRHNVAWQFAESLPMARGASWQKKFKGRWASLDRPSGKVILIEPETFMNLSGESVAAALSFFKMGPEGLLVVHDELELAFGLYGFKKGGGLGGHNGLRSLKACLGTPDFYRLRFGIGRPSHDDVAGYVLSDFAADEREALESVVFPHASSALERAIEEGLDAAVASAPKVRPLEGK